MQSGYQKSVSEKPVKKKVLFIPRRLSWGLTFQRKNIMMLIVNPSHIKALKIIMFKYAKALASTTFVKGDA